MNQKGTILFNIHKIGVVGRTYRHAQRYRQILSVLLKHGFGDIVARLNIEHYLELGIAHLIKDHKWTQSPQLTTAIRLRQALEELGPTFIKLGQLLSTQKDLFNDEYTTELKKLQDDVPPFPKEKLSEIVEAELGGTIEDIFADFTEKPLAAGSIGQVHRARLKEGDLVVVKIQRPGIRSTIEVDLEIMLHIATLMERHLEGMDIHQPTRIIEEFANVLSRELDFSSESGNMDRFRLQFATNPDVYIPSVFKKYSTQRILTMEFIKGTKPSSAAALDEKGLDAKLVARRGFDLILKQIFDHGFFHADPHPGNLMVLRDNIICYLDFGMVGFLSRRERENFADLVIAIARRDSQTAGDVFIRLTEWEEEPNRNKLEKALDSFMNQHFNKSLKEMEIGRLLNELVDIIVSFKMRLPESLTLVIKTLAASEGMGVSLDESFNPISQATPFLKRYQRQRYNPYRLLKEGLRTGSELVRFAGEFPFQFRRLVRQFQRGKTKIEFEHQGLEPLLHTLDVISNRLSLAILVGSLVIGSSVIVLAGIPPKWNNIPLIGIGGFILAGLMSIHIIFAIIRENR